MQLFIEKLSAGNLAMKDNSRLIDKVVTRENSTPEFETSSAREGSHQHAANLPFANVWRMTASGTLVLL
jgi:hypothetical protein